MKLLNVSLLVVTLASFAAAEDQSKGGNPVKTPVKIEVIAKDGAVAAGDHAFVNKDQVVLVQGQKRLVIPVKSITGVSSTTANILSIDVGSATPAEAPSTPLLVKSKDHYVGIVWAEKSETNSVVLKESAAEYWALVTGLQAAGIRVVNADALSVAR